MTEEDLRARAERLEARVVELELFLRDLCGNAEIAERNAAAARYILHDAAQIAAMLLAPAPDAPRSV